MTLAPTNTRLLDPALLSELRCDKWLFEKSPFLNPFSMLLEEKISHSMKIHDPNSIFARFSTSTIHFLCWTLSLIKSIAEDDSVERFSNSCECVAEKKQKIAEKMQLADLFGDFQQNFC
jgi:hypothetical protein